MLGQISMLELRVLINIKIILENKIVLENNENGVRTIYFNATYL